MTINEVLVNYDSFNDFARKESVDYESVALEKKLNKSYERTAKTFYALFKAANGLKVNGLENLEELKGMPYVIVSNHKSGLDPIYINSGLRNYAKVRWISKLENFKGKVFGWFMKIGQVIPLDENRKMTEHSNIRIKEVFEKNEALGIFPEGTRNKTNELLMDFHAGAARICLENSVPYVPVGIIGYAKPFKGKVIINIGKPVYLAGISQNYDNCKSIAQKMRKEVEELLNSPAI